MVGIENDHLGSPARLSAALDHAGKCVEALHEAYGTRSDAASGESFMASAERREIRARAGAPLEEHPLGLHQVHDRLHVVLDGVNEASRALRLRLHAHVEPYRRIEAHFLLHQQVSEIIAKSIPRCRRVEISAGLDPGYERIHYASDQLAHRALTHLP